MGNNGYTLRAAITDLARNGCDLTDPGIHERDRADDAAFYLGYLEEYCETGLTLAEVLATARAMMNDAREAQGRVHLN